MREHQETRRHPMPAPSRHRDDRWPIVHQAGHKLRLVLAQRRIFHDVQRKPFLSNARSTSPVPSGSIVEDHHTVDDRHRVTHEGLDDIDLVLNAPTATNRMIAAPSKLET